MENYYVEKFGGIYDRKKNYVVYCHTNNVNGKKYIGITNNIKRRWSRSGKEYENQVIGRAFQKYGWDSFTHEILYENITKEKAERLERDIISKLKCRINEDGYNVAAGGMLTSDFLMVPVDQYDVNGNFIKSWNGMIEAGNSLGVHATNISAVCTGKTHTCGGYKWAYKGEQPYDGVLNVLKKEVYQFDLFGTLITKYNSISEASATSGVGGTLISKCCSGIIASCGGYLWSFNKKLSANMHEVSSSIVDMYDTDGNYIKTFTSIREAKSYIGGGNIVGSCNGRCITARGYVFRYHGEPFNKYRTAKIINHNTPNPKGCDRKGLWIPVNQYDKDMNFIKNMTL